MERVISLLTTIISYPGKPFAWIVTKFKQMGNGSGNEGSIIEYMLWSFMFGIVMWILFICGAIWLMKHVTIFVH